MEVLWIYNNRKSFDFSHTTNLATLTARRDMADTYADYRQPELSACIRRSRDYDYDYSRLKCARLAVAVATGIRRAPRLVATGSRGRDGAP